MVRSLRLDTRKRNSATRLVPERHGRGLGSRGCDSTISTEYNYIVHAPLSTRVREYDNTRGRSSAMSESKHQGGLEPRSQLSLAQWQAGSLARVPASSRAQPIQFGQISLPLRLSAACRARHSAMVFQLYPGSACCQLRLQLQALRVRLGFPGPQAGGRLRLPLARLTPGSSSVVHTRVPGPGYSG
eukprot:3532117-Rhodomonas_salina.3